VRVQTLGTLAKSSQQGYTLALLISIGIGLIAAYALTYYLKKQLHNLEPKEIARIFEERNAMLDETKDAVVVTDLTQQINLANITAKTLYQQTSGQSDSLIGKKLQDLITELPMVTLNKNTEQLYRQNGQDYLFSAAPILVSAKQIGWIIFLRNTTDSLFVIDQLANTTAYASALQSQSHEFMNKLHVIYGLADLEAYQELKIYLNDILTPEKEFSHRLSFLVKNPQIAGFWIGERQKFAERKTGLTIEISPEIPATANKSETKAVIDLYRYIHHILLRMTLSSECRIEIFYAENKLETNYLLELAQVEQKQLQESLASNYFVQLLGEHDSQFSIELQGDLTVLQLTTHYEKVGEI
jgi:two-component system CitB family sensor kinase